MFLSSLICLQVGEATIPFRSEVKRHRLTPPHTAYLRVAEGCNHACTFCAIPGFRCDFVAAQLHATGTHVMTVVALKVAASLCFTSCLVLQRQIPVKVVAGSTR